MNRFFPCKRKKINEKLSFSFYYPVVSSRMSFSFWVQTQQQHECLETEKEYLLLTPMCPSPPSNRFLLFYLARLNFYSNTFTEGFNYLFDIENYVFQALFSTCDFILRPTTPKQHEKIKPIIPTVLIFFFDIVELFKVYPPRHSVF